MDWDWLKTEYVTSDISYQKLAERHGISPGTLAEHGRMERWPQARREHRARTVQKSLDKIGDQQAENLARVDALADELLQKLDKAIGELDLMVKKHREKGEDEAGNQWQVDYESAEPGGTVDRKGLQQLTASLKDLKEIKALQTELDRLEQEARIRRLQKAGQEAESGAIRVELAEDLEEFGR